MRNKILGVLGAAALAVGVGVSPAQATTAPGEWWSNASICGNAAGTISTQLKYQNVAGKVRMFATGTYTSFPAKVTFIKMGQYWELNGNKLNYTTKQWNFGGIPSNPATATYYANPQFATINPGSPTAPTYGEYAVTVKRNSDGATFSCQGRAQIGM